MKADSHPPVMDLKALYDYCGLPAQCHSHPDWEGRQVTLIGYVDPENIIRRDRSFEKFAVSDRLGRMIEIWPQGRHTDKLFAMLADRSTDRILVKGRLAAFKMHVGTGCVQGIRVLIDDHHHIEFVTE